MKPPKINDVMKLTRDCNLKRRYYFTQHALQRMKERDILHTDLIQALGNGKHVANQDEFNEKRKAWNYRIEAKTFDGKEIGVAVSFNSQKTMAIITVVNL